MTKPVFSAPYGVGHQDPGRSWWAHQRQALPPVQGPWATTYLAALGRAFSSTLSSTSAFRFRFYVADTLNASIWSEGDGRFIVHGGLISRIENADVYHFLIALALAHEVSGHGVTDDRVPDVPLLSGFLLPQSALDIWHAEGFATLVVRDPLVQSGSAYSVDQEFKALMFVAPFFQKMGWDYAAASEGAVSLLLTLATHKGLSGLSTRHKNLELALQRHLPTAVTQVAPQQDIALDVSLFNKVRTELAKSQQQRFVWFAELLPLLSLLRHEGSSLELDLRKLEKEKQMSSQAHSWAEARIRLNHGDYENVAKMESSSEAFMKLKLEALLFSDAPRVCLGVPQKPWLRFDHVRGRLRILCELMDGKITDAKAAAEEYQKVFPDEVLGVFLRGLVGLRLREPIDQELSDMYERWGDRPAFRALQGLKAAYSSDRDGFEKSVAERDDEPLYQEEEVAMNDFARSWGFDHFSDFKAAGYLTKARLAWVPARRHQRLLPAAPY